MMKINIKNIEEEIIFVKGDIGLQGISYDGISTSPTNEIKSSVEQCVLGIQEKVGYLERSKERLQKDIDIVDRGFKKLDLVEKQILRLYYFNNSKWHKISKMVGYSERHCKRIRTKAINKMMGGII